MLIRYWNSYVSSSDLLLFAKSGKRPLAEPGWRLSDAAWRKRLTSFQYKVLREAATERPFTSPLNDEHRAGAFACAGCALPLYSSKTKFESHSGWPSFWAPLKGAVATAPDRKLGSPRTEVHCRRCGGHLGHVFTDGPQRERNSVEKGEIVYVRGAFEGS